MQSVVADGRAYIRNADGRAEIYDIVNDPTERRDLAGSTESQRLLRLRAILELEKGISPISIEKAP